MRWGGKLQLGRSILISTTENVRTMKTGWIPVPAYAGRDPQNAGMTDGFVKTGWIPLPHCPMDNKGSSASGMTGWSAGKDAKKTGWISPIRSRTGSACAGMTVIKRC